MKPIKLILCGWGPYNEIQEIDFTGLDSRGIFLITGATGAGKTTIFDAITYTLYGMMSGEMREKNSVRSDFAKAETPTYAALLLSHAGKEYEVKRNPEYLRPKKKGSGGQEFTKEKENAVLTHEGEVLASGGNEVNRKIQELLGLDYKQFKQLSMIAQGEFTRLLVANSTEKLKIFREIFETGKYDLFSAALRTKAGVLYQEVMEYRHKMEEDIALFSPGEEEEEWKELTGGDTYHYEAICDYLQRLEKQKKQSGQEAEQICRELEEQIRKISTEIAEAERIAGLFRDREETAARMEYLKERETEILSLGKLLERAGKAALLLPAYVEIKRSLESEEKLREQGNCLSRQLKQMTEEKEGQKQIFDMRKEIENAYRTKIEEEKLTKEVNDMTAQWLEIETIWEQRTKEYVDAERSAEQKKREYEEADQVYKRAAAGILAEQLQVGEPCPVCGSREHPAKAPVSSETPKEEQVTALRQQYERKHKLFLNLFEQMTVLKTNREGILRQKEEKESLLQQMREAGEELQPEMKQVLSRYFLEEFLEKMEEYQRLDTKIAERQDRLRQLSEEEMIQKRQTGRLQKEYKTALQKEGFTGEDEVEQYRKEPEEMDSMREEIATFKEQYSLVKERYGQLQKECDGKEVKETGQWKEILADLQERKEEVAEQKNRAGMVAQEAYKICQSLKEKNACQKEISHRYGVVKDLDHIVSGNNKKRMVFEQYVLAEYFEEILRAANIRLRMMTGGRYELRRVAAVTDGRSKDYMEMEVLDYYTGKYRSVKTLSGGESFKTSLALALGMSDVVQALCGGIRVEVLFIDEGFGALDSESLEQACMALQSLVEKERLIGIISHVPELAEKIENQIQVTKTNSGSTVKVMIQ